MNSDWVEVLDAKLTLRVKLCTMVELVLLVLWWEVDNGSSWLWLVPFLPYKMEGTHIHKVSSTSIEGSPLRNSPDLDTKTYFGSWLLRRETNRSICGTPLMFTIWENIREFSFKLLESLWFLDSQSAWTFRLLGKYSAVTVIWLASKWCHYCLEICRSSRLWVELTSLFLTLFKVSKDLSPLLESV